MLKHSIACDDRRDGVTRREAIHSILVAAPFISRMFAEPAQDVRTLDARRFGCAGDGITDDTASLQRAVDAAAASKKTLYVPKGEYRVNATRSLEMRDSSRLQLNNAAILRALPNDAGSSAVLLCQGVRDVQVRGGRIVGERREHYGRAGEWGMGVNILSATNVVVEQVTIEECWGDGVYIGESDKTSAVTGPSKSVTLRDVVSRRNRRQGLSITSCLGGLIERCSFSETEGTLPQSGVDVEPNKNEFARDITFHRCLFHSNRGFGLRLEGSKGSVSDVHIATCISTDNGRDGFQLEQVVHCTVNGNLARSNGGPGIALVDASDNAISRNTLHLNVRSAAASSAQLLLTHASSRNVLSYNVVRGDDALTHRSMITIDSPDCTDNALFGNTGPKGHVIVDHGTGTRYTKNRGPGGQG